MKTKIALFFVILLLSCGYANSNVTESGNNSNPEGSVNVFTSPDLYNLTMKWASVYSNLNPKFKITVTQTAEKSITEKIKFGEGIGFLSEDSYPKQNLSIRNMVVGYDVIVPVMNANNPLLDEIYLKGISLPELVKITENPDQQNWGDLIGSAQKIPVHYLASTDPSVQSGINNLLNTSHSNNEQTKFVSVQKMISAIQEDKNALGFCKLVQIVDINNQSLLADLKIVPIDKNLNGKIDYMEDIYENLQTFSRGVWIGKYPKALSGTIFMVTSEKPKNANEVAFLKWILTDGQQFLNSNGYSELVYAERQTQLAKFDEPEIYSNTPLEKADTFMTILLFALFVIVAAGIISNIAFRHIGNRKEAHPDTSINVNRGFDTETVIIPQGLYFDKTHTWAFRRKNGSIKIGIDDFLQHITGNITRVEMKNSGDRIKKGELLLSVIQKGKLLNIYSPISGIITENNKSLKSNASLLNSSPYAKGWVYVIEPANWGLEINYLTIAEKYKIWLSNEFLRLRDFFSTEFKANSPELAHVVMQDGGTLKDNILADLGPEVWEDFQTKFIDPSK